MSTPTLLDRARALLANSTQATARPWKWWTSNSRDRLSSEPSGKDGDVLDATRAADGVPVVIVRIVDKVFVAGACNNADELAAFAVEFARALPGLYREHAALVMAAPGDAPGGAVFERCPRGDGSCVCGVAAHNARLDALADKLGIPPEERRR